ncbi:hypothetical protein EJB05_36961 [Eragrostis curvula]|uniref:FBD domain-containing protein n=1 Tax=Eragrostis curvula TaxID=38414 RepID=A0A5J9TZP0_9POAL|nr:hypothetical protein EJB05_36961 [Eragrostis curvula]
MILSQSVKQLSITDCFFSPTRIRIRAPKLVSLEICYSYGKAPLLDKMPSLETAVFSISPKDYCDGAFSAECSGACLNCCSNNDQNTSDILGGLSNTTKLELRIFYGTLILGRRCPTFSRLKALLLKVPGQANDLHSIVCILGRSPVLEKLTLQLSEGDIWTGESEGMYQTRDQLPAISQLLDTVEIKCREVDERVCFIMKFLSRFIKHININLNGIP